MHFMFSLFLPTLCRKRRNDQSHDQNHDQSHDQNHAPSHKIVIPLKQRTIGLGKMIMMTMRKRLKRPLKSKVVTGVTKAAS